MSLEFLLRGLGTEQVDYRGVAAAKGEVLGHLHAHFRQHHLATDSERALEFRAFQRAGGESLRAHALFEALQGRFHAEDPAIWGWPVWPEAWRDPASPLVRRFERDEIERVGSSELGPSIFGQSLHSV